MRVKSLSCLVLIAILALTQFNGPVEGSDIPGPMAAFSLDETSGDVGDVFTFTDASVAGSGGLRQWTFDYGDGTEDAFVRSADPVPGLRPVAFLEGGAFAAACFVDDDADGLLDLEEPLYLSTAACHTVSAGDVRLVSASGHPAGSVVRRAHADFHLPESSLSFPVRFYDADGDATLSMGDSVYGDLDGSGSVSDGDLRLTAFGSLQPGTRVFSTDADQNLPLASLFLPGPSEWRFLDLDGDGVWYADEVFLDLDGDGLVTVGDVQVSPFTGMVGLQHERAVSTLGSLGGAIRYVDEDASGAYAAGEPVYFVPNPAVSYVAAGSVRLVSVGMQAPGSVVRPTHPDFGQTAISSPLANVGAYDADGDGDFTIGDSLYVDMDGTATGTVGDVRVTAFGPFAAGTLVSAGDVDLNLALGTGATLDAPNWRYLDGDADGRWTYGDRLFVDADGDQMVAYGDIRLDAGPPGYGRFVDATDGDAVALGKAASIGGPFSALCYLDEDGSMEHERGEPIYAARSACSMIGTGDLRISQPTWGGPAYQVVRAVDPDFGSALRALSGWGVGHYDGDGDGVWSEGDTAYLTPDGRTARFRLDAFGAFAGGRPVALTDPDALADLSPLPGVDVTKWDLLDLDADGAWTRGDVVFLDFHSDGAYTGADLLLASATVVPDGAAVTHAYAAPGTYDVVLTVVDEHGLSSWANQTVTVADAPLSVSIGLWPLVAKTGEEFRFLAEVRNAEGHVAFSWTFGDGDGASGENATHRYEDDGTYTVTVVASDERGQVATATLEVTVENRAPQAAFLAPTRVTNLQNVTFQDRSTDPDGSISAWTWSFGDGATADTPDAVHRYDRSGAFTACLTVQDDDHDDATTCQNITVVPVSMSGRAAPVTADGLVSHEAGDTGWNGSTSSSYTWATGDQVDLGAMTVTEAIGEVWLEPGSSSARARFADVQAVTGPLGGLSIQGVDAAVETGCAGSSATVRVARIAYQGVTVWDAGVVPQQNTTVAVPGLGVLRLNVQEPTADGLRVTGVLWEGADQTVRLGLAETAVTRCSLA